MQILHRNCLLRSCYKRFTAVSYSNYKQTETVSQKYTPIYSFPYIKVFAFINRLKLYQTGITLVSIPSSAVAVGFDVLSTENGIVISAIGLAGCATLYGLGQICSKYIGFIYVNEDISVVKVAYVDFWGKRRDVEIPVNDIVPFAEIPPSATDRLFSKFVAPSLPSILKMNIKSCKILDKNKFDKVFPFSFLY